MYHSSKCTFVSIGVLLLFAFWLNAQEFNPDDYLEASRATVSLPRAIAAYNQLIYTQEPDFYGIFDINATTRGYNIPSIDGDLSGYFFGVDGFACLRFLTIGNFSFRLLDVLSAFGFFLDGTTLHNYSSVYDSDSNMGWLAGYNLFGLQMRSGTDRLTLGAILRFEPMVDAGPPSVFSHTPKEGDKDVITENTYFDRFYIDGSLYGINIDTLFSISRIEQAAADKLFDIVENIIELGPVAEYFGRIQSFRPGVSTVFSPVSWFIISAKAEASIDAHGFGLGEAGLDIAMPFTFIRNIKETGADFGMRLDFRTSYLNYYGSMIPGFMGEITLSNYPFFLVDIWIAPFINYLGYLAAGVSWNYSDTLLRLPFKDQPILYLRMGGSYSLKK